MKKKRLGGLFFILVLLFSIFLMGNDYDMTESSETIPTPMGKLAVVMTQPKNKKATGIVLFVHGDGAQNATQDGGYKPLMERFAQQGFIAVSWDKLGVGKSSGNWLDQTMDDRSKEVSYVISWLKKNYPSESGTIGLWGASQAGWVIPRVLTERTDIRFSILVGPAINWLRQGAYDTEHHVQKNKKKLAQAKQEFWKDSKLIEQNGTYKAYREAGGKEQYNPQRYQFIRRNMQEDVTGYLKNIHSDLFLIVADQDRNVDSNETERIYSKEVEPQYLHTKRIAKVGHQMLHTKIEGSKILTYLSAVFTPKYFLLDKNYLDYCEEIVKTYNDRGASKIE